MLQIYGYRNQQLTKKTQVSLMDKIDNVYVGKRCRNLFRNESLYIFKIKYKRDFQHSKKNYFRLFSHTS